MSMDPTKLKVAELKEELIARNLDSRGLKAVLVKRLRSALAVERDDFDAEDSGAALDCSGDFASDSLNESVEQSGNEIDQSINETNNVAVEGDSGGNDVLHAGDNIAEGSHTGVPQEAGTYTVLDLNTSASDTNASPGYETKSIENEAIESIPWASDSDVTASQPTEAVNSDVGDSDLPAEQNSPKTECVESNTEEDKADIQSSTDCKAPAPDCDASVTAQPTTPHEQQGVSGAAAAVKSENVDNSDCAAAAVPLSSVSVKTESGDDPHPANDVSQQQEDQTNDVQDEKDTVAKETPMDIKQETSVVDATKSPSDHGLKRSLSPDARDAKKPNIVVDETYEPEFDESRVVLDWYNSDLSLVIDADTRLTARPLSQEGFGYMWSGARATYGFAATAGLKVRFEVKVTAHNDVKHLQQEPNPHVVRVGWSTDDSSLQLGEEPRSFGYGGTAKFSRNLKFSDYGCQFGADDVVGAYADLSADPVRLYFTVNGRFQGEACTIARSELDSEEGRPAALFPHVLSKNCEFSVNMGQAENAWFDNPTELADGYVFCESVALAERSRGARGPSTKAECTIIMMVGLPGSGKTTWVDQFTRQHASQRYNVLGTNSLIDRMKVMGLPRKKNYHGRWEQLISSCTRCLNILLEMAHKRRRNYIIDQTNVYQSAQRRKMRHFTAFKRRCMVLVPSHEEYERRVAQSIRDENKAVPTSALLEMKAAFQLPKVGEYLDDVEFAELAGLEAQQVIDKYALEAKQAGVMPPWERRKKTNNNASQRGAGRGGGPFNQRQFQRDTRGGGYSRGGWQQGGADRRSGAGGGWWSSAGGQAQYNGSRNYSGGAQQARPQPWASSYHPQARSVWSAGLGPGSVWASGYAGQQAPGYGYQQSYGGGYGQSYSHTQPHQHQRQPSGYGGNYGRGSGAYGRSSYGPSSGAYNRR